MPGSIDMDTLAKELQRQGETLSALAKTTISHVDGCGELNRKTALEMTAMRESVQAIEARFVAFDRVMEVALVVLVFLGKHGKKLVLTSATVVFSAWLTVLVQNVLLHRETATTAQQAAVSAKTAAQQAQQAANGQLVVIRKLNEIEQTPGP